MNEKTAQYIIEALDGQNERVIMLEQLIKGQQEQLTLLPDYRGSVTAWNKELIELNNILRQIKIPAKEIADLKVALSENTTVRKNPPEIRHHHYVPKVALFAGTLLLLLVLACVGWYSTAGKLKQHQAADTRYRYLKLERNATLRQFLFIADSFYRKNPDGMSAQVTEQEEALRRRLELFEQAQGKESEARELRRKAAGNEK